MSNEKYFIDIGEEGSIGLTRLDYCFNKNTQDFLLKAGLKPGMKMLDIGCGSGIMTSWIAQQIGKNGKIIAIENDEHQLHAAETYAKKIGINNIEFKLCSAYEIDSLKETFDFVYCRFVLHHLNDPMQVIMKIFNTLNKNGVYAAEEGIVNFAFSYPFSSAWGDESLCCPPVWTDADIGERDGNIGVKLFKKLHLTGFNNFITDVYHPLLITKKEKSLLLIGRDEYKRTFLEQGSTEQDWIEQGNELQKIINDDSQILGFYASCQVAGKK